MLLKIEDSHRLLLFLDSLSESYGLKSWSQDSSLYSFSISLNVISSTGNNKLSHGGAIKDFNEIVSLNLFLYNDVE